MPQYSIPYDSNLRYLPLVYFLPEDTIAKYPALRALGYQNHSGVIKRIQAIKKAFIQYEEQQ